MRRPWIKLIIYSLILIVGILIIAAGSIALKYRSLKKNDVQVEVTQEVVLAPEDEIPLGSVATATTLFKCPWTKSPDSANLIPADGSQNVGKPKIKLQKIGWGYWIWEVQAKLQSYRTGKIKVGKLTVHFKNGKSEDNGTTELLPVPEFSSTPLKVDSDELSIASHLDDVQRKSHKYLWWSLCGIAVIAVIVIYLMMRRRHAQDKALVLPPWTLALTAIRELREHLQKGLISGEFCITRLTDIVRNYLESSLHIHASTRTTPEFMNDLNQPNSPLDEKHRSFLREFLKAADLVKFAKFPADSTILGNAIEKANELILETSGEKQSESPDQSNTPPTVPDTSRKVIENV